MRAGRRQLSVSTDHRHLVSPHVRSVTNTDGAILLDTDTGLMFSVNHVGGLIWESLHKGRTEDEIVNLIVERFQISRDQASSDIRSFSTELRQKQLLL